MSTQDPYGSQDQPREQRTGSSADSSGGYGQQAPPGYSQQPPSGYSQQPPAGYQGQPPAGGHGGYDRPAPRNGLGVAALVLGILALLSGFFVIGGLLGIVAIVLGVIGSRRVKRGEATNRGMAITGIVLGVIGVLLSVVAIAIGAFFGTRVANCNTYLEQDDQAGYQQCLEQQLGVDSGAIDS